jgi:glycosyltransferase involved in cell wall biosynthesis
MSSVSASFQPGVKLDAAGLAQMVAQARAGTFLPPRPLRILWCSWKDRTHPLAGGAEEYSDRVRRGLVERGHDVHLATSAVAGQPSLEVVDGVSVYRRGGPLDGVYRSARVLYDRSWAEWDVVVDEVNTRPFGAPRWSRGTPVVAHVHQVAREVWSFETPFPIALAGRFVLEPWWLRAYKDTIVTTISQSSTESLEKYNVFRSVNVGIGGVGATRLFAPQRDVVPTVVAVGRVCGMKRQVDILQAHRLLLERRPDTQLWFVGAGPDLEMLRRLAADVRGVEVFGRVSLEEKEELVSKAWVHVCASVREGWGLVVSEAAAAGTFTVAYNRPGLVDSVRSSGGVLCDPTPAALAAALDANLDRLKDLAPSSTGVVSWDEVVVSFEAALAAAVTEGGGR